MYRLRLHLIVNRYNPEPKLVIENLKGDEHGMD